MSAHRDPRWSDRRVAGVVVPSASYDAEGRVAADALERLGAALGWAAPGRGAMANVIPEGARVLVKPNFVLHENQGPWGHEALITHASIVRAATDAALRAGASQVIVGDAPVQGCDFDRLMAINGLGRWAGALARQEPRFKGVRDFRRTTCVLVNGVRVSAEGLIPEDQFVLFDLGRDSLLEPITDPRDSFRVTCYDPRLLAKTHARNRHQYLVARDVLEADVIVNLPKLKTHKKAGITCALKNLIGINGNKEYLPHHRVGGSTDGGDCYPGASRVKALLERVADRQNMATSRAAGRVWSSVATQLDRIARLRGDRIGIEGSWSGNDTIWRTCLDLNRILLYGRVDASLAPQVQRTAVHIADAIVAGQGDGPLAPQPLPLGLLFAGHNAAAVDWVGARLLGFDPERVPLVRHAFDAFPWPIAPFAPQEISLDGHWPAELVKLIRDPLAGPMQPVVYPAGWVNASARTTAA